MSKPRTDFSQHGLSRKSSQRHLSPSLRPVTTLTPVIKQSPYTNQVISKIRSTSVKNHKSKRPVRTRQISPLISKCPSNISLKKQRNSEKTTVSHSQLPSAHSLGLDQPLPKAVMNRVNTSNSSLSTESPRRYAADISVQLNKWLDWLQNSKQKDRCQILQRVFSEVLEKNLAFRPVLEKIKVSYQLLLKEKDDFIDSLNKKIEEDSEVIFQYKIDLKTVYRKLEKLSKENYQLAKSLDGKDSQYKQIYDQLLKISKFNIDQIPKNKESWKLLVMENKQYAKLCQELKKDLKEMKEKEQKIMSVVLGLKQKGYPIEEMNSSRISYSQWSDTQAQNLISKSDRQIIKPQNVPTLFLNQLLSDSSDSSESNHS